MKIKQVSVFMENQPGRLLAMLEALTAQNINIRALCVAEGSDFGIVRLILSEVTKGAEALRKAGFTVTETVVLQVEMPDKPGGLLESVARPLAQAGINLEYFYAFIDPTPGKAVIVLKVNDPDRAEKVIGQ
ncbi:MAG: ACT domain-containing protein [Chloroflexi bacterium]|nr:ACT domain-containing protein [Chloroflexota bacterium]